MERPDASQELLIRLLTSKSQVAAADGDCGVGGGLIERLRKYQFGMVPPAVHETSAKSITLDIGRLRHDVFAEFDSVPRRGHPLPSAGDSIDRCAWHIVVHVGAQLVGCLRCIVFDCPLAPDICQRILQNSGCQLRAADRALCTSSIRAFLARRRPKESPVIQFGGFAVDARARGTAVAFGLCLAATAFTRAIGSGGGVLMAADKSRTERLYARAGGFRLQVTGRDVPPLCDAFHRDRVLVMGTAPFGNEARFEPAIEYLESCLFDDRSIAEVTCA